MILLLKLVSLSLLVGLIILAVRFLIVPGIDKACLVLNYGSKARGQLLGYATSTPELVVVISSATAGVFDVGFWNIASSNIINWMLFLSAVFIYRQFWDLKRKIFIDEILFGLFSVICPLLLYIFKVHGSIILALGLLFIFFVHKLLDRKFNRKVALPEERSDKTKSFFSGISSMIVGVILIIVTGRYIGELTKELVVDFGISMWLVGWILGFVSSIPEMSGFFEIYRKHKKNGTPRRIDDTQEALDTLVASNMSNFGIILPVGIFIVALL